MKPICLSACLFLAFFFNLFSVEAQGTYLGIDAGYGFPASKQLLTADVTSKTNTYTNPGSSGSTTSVTNQSAPYSMGKGINAGLFGGYMLTKNLGIELGVGYLMGLSTSQTTETDKLTSNTVATPGSSTNSTDISTTSFKGSMLRLIPGVRVQFGNGKIHPYASAGLIVGVLGSITKETVDNNSLTISNSTSNTSNTNDDIWKYSGRISMGFHGALGVTYLFTQKLGFFAELTSCFQTYSPGKALHTVSTTNGKDNLAIDTENLKETDYSSSYTSTTGTGIPTATGSPAQALYQVFPFSSVGLTVGLHLAFGNKD